MVGAYLVGDASAEEVVCVAADAPGWRAPDVRRFARRLAVGGALVVMPDLWRGDTWYGEPSPTARVKNAGYSEWAVGHPTEKVSSDLAAVMTALRERGAKRISVVGMGLGAGAVVNLLVSQGTTEEEEACPPASAALVCPLGVDASAAAEAARSSVPVLFVWGGGDAAAAAAAKAELAMERSVGESNPSTWASRVFTSQDDYFALLPHRGGSRDGAGVVVGDKEKEQQEEDEVTAAELVLKWTTTTQNTAAGSSV